jgi:hypothetical protein
MTNLFGGSAKPPAGGNPDSNTLISDTTTVLCLDDYQCVRRAAAAAVAQRPRGARGVARRRRGRPGRRVFRARSRVGLLLLRRLTPAPAPPRRRPAARTTATAARPRRSPVRAPAGAALRPGCRNTSRPGGCARLLAPRAGRPADARARLPHTALHPTAQKFGTRPPAAPPRGQNPSWRALGRCPARSGLPPRAPAAALRRATPRARGTAPRLSSCHGRGAAATRRGAPARRA